MLKFILQNFENGIQDANEITVCCLPSSVNHWTVKFYLFSLGFGFVRADLSTTLLCSVYITEPAILFMYILSLP